MYNCIALKGPLYSLSQQLIYSIYESTPKAVPIFFSAGGVNASAGVLLIKKQNKNEIIP